MNYTTYLCDDFYLDSDGLLTIYGSYAEFTSNDSEDIIVFIANYPCNAAVCPQLYVNENNINVKKVIFK